mgnify:CR=1 FL=1
MNVAQARRLLSVTEEDDLHSLKKKYRQLMNTCHPDALGSEEPEHIRQAGRHGLLFGFRIGHNFLE